METTSYRQPSVASSTLSTIWRGVRSGPESTLTSVRRPDARALMCEPPMSTTSTFFIEMQQIG